MVVELVIPGQAQTEISEAFSAEEVERLRPLTKLETPNLEKDITVYQGVWGRNIPHHYTLTETGSRLCKTNVTVNVLTFDGTLFVPDSRIATFENIFEKVKKEDPELFDAVLHPGNTAKSAGSDKVTAIKKLIGEYNFPGEVERGGWNNDAEEIRIIGKEKILAAQLNDLYFNDGSVHITAGGRVLIYPQMFLADKLESRLPAEELERFGISKENLKRPLIILAATKNGALKTIIFKFSPEETFKEGIKRLEERVRDEGITSGIGCSPPLVLPDENSNPCYLTLNEAIAKYHATDIRHYFYLPYKDISLLYPELSRKQRLDPEMLAKSISGSIDDRVTIKLSETLEHFNPNEIRQTLDTTGYEGRYKYSEQENTLSINLLEGVYPHLVMATTKRGRMALLQTSGAHGRITGNDGPTYRQLVAIIKDINEQEYFIDDPIVTAFSSSQGNDVTDIWARGSKGKVARLHELAPVTRLQADDEYKPRGERTTPQVSIISN